MTGMNTEAVLQKAHGVLPKPTGEEESRQLFVKSLKYHLASKVAPGNKLAYEARAKPEWVRAKGRAPADHNAIRQAMAADPYFRMWSALQRTSQEMMWRSVQVSVERDLDQLKSNAQPKGETLGSLTLNPDIEIPVYHTAVDIHCMPGGYHGEFGENDIANGAVYDRGVWIYAMGRMGPLNDDMGRTVGEFLKTNHPDFQPQRILDMGCTVGHSTLPYVDLYPDAEIHAIDVGAPVLRYAHARAESLGKKVHFSQQNAEHTSFEDGTFDLVVSHILVHETSNKAIRNIMREAYRLLKPGGMVIHVETPPYSALTDFDVFMLDWDTRNNNEPYWGASHEIDPAGIAEQTGFGADAAFDHMQPSAFDQAERHRTKVFQAGDFGGGGAWYLWGARKKAAS